MGYIDGHLQNSARGVADLVAVAPFIMRRKNGAGSTAGSSQPDEYWPQPYPGRSPSTEIAGGVESLLSRRLGLPQSPRNIFVKQGSGCSVNARFNKFYISCAMMFAKLGKRNSGIIFDTIWRAATIPVQLPLLLSALHKCCFKQVTVPASRGPSMQQGRPLQAPWNAHTMWAYSSSKNACAGGTLVQRIQ
ncbi:hypothetical protein WJX73_010164 [Symbiochloris irregularis]|uniref:Uncharacterized protein n=1 Tax=Symbiochloris irregularis TaxID=706552 RepID=A0AAW1NT05_9CHLO